MTDDPTIIVRNVSNRGTRITALFVVIGILIIQLKSFNREVGPERDDPGDFRHGDADEWESRADYAKSMPKPSGHCPYGKSARASGAVVIH